MAVAYHSEHSRMRPSVLAVLPAYNEGKKIKTVLSKIPDGIVDAVVVVDDFSSDNTAEEAIAGKAIVLRHPVNQGVGAAIRTGIDFGLQNHYDIVVILSSDDQHVPSEFPRVLLPLLNNQCDFVQGSRRMNGGRSVNSNLFRKVTTLLYTFVFRMLTGFPSTDATNGFRAFRLSIFEDSRINIWQKWLDRYELEPYLLYKAIKTGKSVREVPISIIYHKEGTTKMRAFLDWWKIFRPLVYLSLRLQN